MNGKQLSKDFASSCKKLEEALKEKHPSELEQAGSIQYFELAFELAWKTCKAKAEELGITEVRSPKAALKEAKTQGWLGEEKAWLEMLEARNRMAHVNSSEQALEVYGRMKVFSKALSKLSKSFA
ncbi:MAG: nucleotidyltransferase [Verrucomicrobia bacterium]|nr:nucleotidyltransferase [Verrucomicrobiota bacterium]